MMRPRKKDENNPEGDFPPPEWFGEIDTYFYPVSIAWNFDIIFIWIISHEYLLVKNYYSMFKNTHLCWCMYDICSYSCTCPSFYV